MAWNFQEVEVLKKRVIELNDADINELTWEDARYFIPNDTLMQSHWQRMFRQRDCTPYAALRDVFGLGQRVPIEQITDPMITINKTSNLVCCPKCDSPISRILDGQRLFRCGSSVDNAENLSESINCLRNQIEQSIPIVEIKNRLDAIPVKGMGKWECGNSQAFDYYDIEDVRMMILNPPYHCEGCGALYAEYVNGCPKCWDWQLSDEENQSKYPNRKVVKTDGTQT